MNATSSYLAVVTGASTGIVAGNKMRAAMAHIAPDSTLAEMHRGMAAPGSGKAEEPKSKQKRTDRPRA